MSDEFNAEPHNGAPLDPEPAPAPEPVSAPVAPEPAPAAHVAVTGTSKPGRIRSGAVWWGVILIAGGLALLASQLVPQFQLWRFWPLIIIAFGIRAMFGSSGTPWSIKALTEGLSTVAVGLIFLGQMLGYLAWDVWLNILRLWPLLLVALGLEIAGKGLRSEWVRALGNVVVIGGLAYGALVMTSTGGWPPVIVVPAGETLPFEFGADNLSSAEEGTARIEGGVGELTVSAGPELATAKGHSPFEPEFEVTRDPGTADVMIGLGEHTWGPTDSNTELDVTLSEDVVWDLDISAGVTEYDIDLTDLMLSALVLDAGVSDGTVTLGDSDAAGIDEGIPVEIESGVSALRIRIPEGDNVRVTIQQGLTGVDMRGSWDRDRDEDTSVYESDRFDDDGAYWDIEIQAGIGGITVEYY